MNDSHGNHTIWNTLNRRWEIAKHVIPGPDGKLFVAISQDYIAPLGKYNGTRTLQVISGKTVYDDLVEHRVRFIIPGRPMQPSCGDFVFEVRNGILFEVANNPDSSD